jgi:alpha-L-fucosidase
MFAQVKELLSNYGKIDLLWFDGGWERKPEEWQARQLHEMIRSLQPHLLINDRLPGFGDFDTCEQFIPPQPPQRTWEACLTLNESWGYNPEDTQFKSARQLIHTLCEVAGKGGNLLLNVSPMGNGQIQSEQLELLQFVEEWMAVHASEYRRNTAWTGTLAILRSFYSAGQSLLLILADEALRFSNSTRCTH